MFATAASSRSAEPASVPSARTGGSPPPAGSSISSPPSRYRPGGMPAHAVASVTRQIRPGAAANAITQAGPATCRRSAIRPLVSRGSASAWPTTPGSRWCIGRCALYKWVTIRAPASAAAATCAAVASLCPTLTSTPAAASWRTAASAPSSSGASVTSRTSPAPAASSASIAAADGGMIHAGLCAPRRLAAMNGPSTCTPSTRARPAGSPGTIAAAARSAAVRPASGEVMKVGMNEVTPVAGIPLATAAQPAALAVISSSPR